MPHSEKQKHIRNFSIIAHIDHGKSTLADRILEFSNTVAARDMEDQLLDNMDLERERGITIKARAVRIDYTAPDGEQYALNMIDTPGHVDFNYEVSRSLNACEGALLVVDATQGIEAQTLANAYLAVDANLEIVPVINKIDLPSAMPDKCKAEIEDVIGIPAEDCPVVSAKTGLNIADVMDAIVRDIPAPEGDPDAPLSCLIFDSVYNSYLGVVVYIRVMDGTLRVGDRIRLMHTGAEFDVVEVGVMDPFGLRPTGELSAGEVGYLTASIKNVSDTRVGDTVTHADNPAAEPLPGFKKVQSMVFAGIYPADGARYNETKDALEKLQLNDAAFSFEPETSIALGFGFRCGFLGLLHMEIVQERLRREFNCDVISTNPAVVYRVHGKDGKVQEIDNPIRLPDPADVDYIEEPLIRATIITPSSCIGDMMRIVMEHRGTVDKTDSLDGVRVILTCTLPLNEILVDFNDTLKSVSHGYASLDYVPSGYQRSDIVRMDILLNGDAVDAFACMVHRDRARARGKEICAALKDAIPPHMFKIPVQAAVGGTIVAREDIRPFRKDVTAKLYGGDITRKMKLLNKQKEGKKRMKQFGTVNVPQEAFVAVLRSGANEDSK